MDTKIAETINEIVAQMSVVLGPNMALLEARSVSGLRLDDKGNVVSVSGDHLSVLKSLISCYTSISGQVVRHTIDPILQDHLNTSLI